MNALLRLTLVPRMMMQQQPRLDLACGAARAALGLNTRAATFVVGSAAVPRRSNANDAKALSFIRTYAQQCIASSEHTDRARHFNVVLAAV